MDVEGLDKVLANIKKMGNEKGFKAAVIATYGETVTRIFEKGKASDESIIGQYSTEPIYVSSENSPRKLRPLGKNGKSKFKNGNKKKSRYFEGGYKEFRSAVGRDKDTNHVNLKMTGKLRSEFQLDTSNLPYVAKFTTDISAEIAEGNEERFGKEIFEMTEKEVENLVRRTLEFSKNG